jgi:hybrid cluster-associated redox disulfide protein
MNPFFTPDTPVSEVLSQYPQTVPVFFKHHMSCVGCSMSGFETLSSATAIYKIPLERFLQDLHAAITPQPADQ